MELKKIPSNSELLEVYAMAHSLGLSVYSFLNFDEDGVAQPVGDIDKKYALINKNFQPLVPYKMTFWELKDKLIFLGGVAKEVI